LFPRAAGERHRHDRIGRTSPSHLRAALFALFAVSGFAGLIYESIWTQYLKLFLGHAAYAQALVLAIFMGGMAVGSLISGRWSTGWRRLLIAYAAIEAAIGALGLIFHPLFTGVTGLAYETILPRLGTAVVPFKWLLGAILILPQCVLLGMTFPLMTAGTLRAFPERPGRSVAALYFANSLGAAVGVLASGFWLMTSIGLPGTMGVAAVLNFAVAAAVAALFRRRHEPERADIRAAPGLVDPHRTVFLLFLGAALVTGASSFIYEIAWIRMLTLVLGGSTHSFELMLGAFIFGLALGGLFIQHRIDGLHDPARALGFLQLAMGLLAIATMLIYGRSFEVMRWLLAHLERTDRGYILFNLFSNAIALAVMLPATFCAGTTLPLITFHLLRRGHGERSIGSVYAANTIGAIAGVFFAIHVGLPALGLKNLLILGGVIDIALGVALLWTSAVGPVLGAASLGLVALAIAFVDLDPYRMASGVYRTGKLLDPSVSRVIYQRDGKTATVSVVGHEQMNVLDIATNGKVDAAVMMPADQPPTPDEPMMILLGAIPMALHPAARNAACIGFGAGITTQTLLQSPQLSRVETVEIEEEMVRAAQHFRPRNELAFSDPRSRIVVDDAKTFFSTQSRRYDLIVSEPSNPWVSGVAGLFSNEFYRLVRRHMAEGALFAQWIQLYEIDLPLVISVLKALEANFDDYTVYATTNVDLIIVAKNGGQIGLPQPAVLATPDLSKALDRIGVRSMQDLELRRVGTRRSWDGLTRSFAVPMNSDYLPVLDDGAARTLFLHANARTLVVLEKRIFPAVEMLSGLSVDDGVTALTPAPFFVGSRLGLEAMWLRDALLHRLDASERFVVSPELHEHARVLAEWLGNCAERALPLRSLLLVAEAMLAELRPRDLETIWSAVHGCDQSLSARDREWLVVLESIGRRDGKQTAAASRAVLAAEPRLDSASRRFLVTAGMLGSLAQGDVAAARNLWLREGRSIELADDLLLRILVARSVAE